MTPTNRPKSAATLILVRPVTRGGFEILLTRRPVEMNFLGGFHVFPGGAVRKEDYDAAMFRQCVGRSPLEAQTILGGDLSPELCLGHWVASVRELFEEVGVLFCVTQNGAPVDMKNAVLKERLTEKRFRVVDGTLSFQAVLESEGLSCDLARISYFSRWQTPEEFSIRFDTRFYIALLPQSQSVIGDSREVTEIRWTPPELAMLLYQEGKLPLIFPTYASLRTLADFDSLDSLCAAYQLR
jgi:8-oxo-dGTP pyrophosphatase MutT (NUDIX family)